MQEGVVPLDVCSDGGRTVLGSGRLNVVDVKINSNVSKFEVGVGEAGYLGERFDWGLLFIKTLSSQCFVVNFGFGSLFFVLVIETSGMLLMSKIMFGSVRMFELSLVIPIFGFGLEIKKDC